MSQSEPFELHMNWVISFMLNVMYIYIGSSTSNSRGLYGLTLILAWIINYMHLKSVGSNYLLIPKLVGVQQ